MTDTGTDWVEVFTAARDALATKRVYHGLADFKDIPLADKSLPCACLWTATDTAYFGITGYYIGEAEAQTDRDFAANVLRMAIGLPEQPHPSTPDIFDWNDSHSDEEVREAIGRALASVTP